MRRLVPVALLGLIAAVGCTQDFKSADIVSETPWTPPEEAEYRVLDDDDDEVGTLTMTIEPDDDGIFLHQYFDFPEAGFTNDARVLANPQDLQPISASFQIQGPEGDLNCDATYIGSEVTVERVGEDETRTDEIDVPTIAYDSWSDLFVWRTIEFSEGYSVEYTDILSCTLDRTQKLGVTLTVEEREEITVPGGTFETWRLEIDSGGATQTAWYSTDDSRQLIRYDNGSEVFELTD